MDRPKGRWKNRWKDGQKAEQTDPILQDPSSQGRVLKHYCSTGWLLPMFTGRYFDLDRFICSEMNDFQVIFSYILEKLVFVVFCESPQINFTWK